MEKLLRSFFKLDKVQPRYAIAKSSIASVASSVQISDFCTISDDVQIGPNCQIGPSTVIGKGVIIEEGTKIGSNVTLENCIIGKNNVIHSGVRIGQDGFGFQLSSDGGEHAKKPQELIVEVKDNVEIGANTTIDRGSWRNTVIGLGCKLDNLIQIGHNVQLGDYCVIAAQSGIAGSTSIGSNVHIGGQVGIVQHVAIGDNVRIAARSAVMNNLEKDQTFGGTPAVPIMEFRRLLAHNRKIGKKK